LAYQMVAERDNETIRSTRASALIAVAKARIFIEEGWTIHITDENGRTFEPAEFHLLPAVNEPNNESARTAAGQCEDAAPG
jgi:hypothetical protein